jgi:hypothetical protein
LGLGVAIKKVFIVRINRLIKMELRELPGDHGLPPRLQSKNRIML